MLDVFDTDNGDESEDLMIIGEKVGKSNKGKTSETNIHQVVVCIKLFVISCSRLILSFLTFKVILTFFTQNPFPERIWDE